MGSSQRFVLAWICEREGEHELAVATARSALEMYGRRGKGDLLAIFARPGKARAPGPGFHLAFNAPDRQSVDAFHAAAVKAGGTDDGAPGLREKYSPTYYAAFVIDPDGHKLEAVHQ